MRAAGLGVPRRLRVLKNRVEDHGEGLADVFDAETPHDVAVLLREREEAMSPH